MARSLALLALASACGNPGAQPASPDAATLHPPPPTPDAAADAATALDFTETFAPGSDTGHWILTTSSMRPRMIDASGGNPAGYLYAEVASTTPTWTTMSTHYAPGNNDSVKRDSVFVGDYATAQVTHMSVDLEIQQAGTWSSNRTLTIELRTWSAADGAPSLVADASLPDIASPPSGWNHYDFMIDAASPTVPAGWTLVHGDGSQADAIEWASLMHRIDYVGIGYYKPNASYPSGGTWDLGMDNIHITAQ